MELIAEKRQKLGKAVQSLKAEGKVPAVIFGKKMESIPVIVEAVNFKKFYEKAGETDLVDLKVEEKTYKVLIKDVQFDPVKGDIIHAGFYKPDLTVKTEVQIPVELVGEEEHPLVKNGTGVLIYLVNEITVKALPADLPHSFIIQATMLENIGDSVTVSQLDFDRSKVEIVDLEDDDEVVKLDAVEVQEEEPVVDEAEALAKIEATGEKKPEDEDGEEAKD